MHILGGVAWCQRLRPTTHCVKAYDKHMRVPNPSTNPNMRRTADGVQYPLLVFFFFTFHWLRMLWFSDWLIYFVEFVKSVAEPAHTAATGAATERRISITCWHRWQQVSGDARYECAHAYGSGTGYLWLNSLKRHIRFVRIHNVELIENLYSRIRDVCVWF